MAAWNKQQEFGEPWGRGWVTQGCRRGASRQARAYTSPRQVCGVDAARVHDVRLGKRVAVVAQVEHGGL